MKPASNLSDHAITWRAAAMVHCQGVGSSTERGPPQAGTGEKVGSGSDSAGPASVPDERPMGSVGDRVT